MEKQILTELLGADFAAKITEDADVKAIIEDAKKSLKDKYFEAFKNDPEYNDGIKSSSKAMGIAEASMKAKKKIKTLFGLEVSNKEMEELDIEELVNKGIEGIKSGVASDVNELNQKIIEKTNENNKLLEQLEVLPKEIENKYKAELKQRDISTVIERGLFLDEGGKEKKYILPKEKALVLFNASLKEEGLTLDIENGELVFKKGDYVARTKDDSGFENLRTFRDRILGELEIKNNGTQAIQNTSSIVVDETDSPAMQELKRIAAGMN